MTTLNEYQIALDDVMEFIDNNLLQSKLPEVETEYKETPSLLNKVRLGIIYHEVALNLGFFNKHYKGYAQKSLTVLSDCEAHPQASEALQPFILSYKASAMALVAAETFKLSLIGKSFQLFEITIQKYGAIHYLPEFMRGSVAENLPWFYFRKRALAKIDFENIIRKQAQHPEYASWKIMSFVYWAWAKQHPQRKYRSQALAYLQKAIELDPNYLAGRKRSEELIAKFAN
ncbi:hypothetical protein [Capnocytophaga sp. oral taxon 878]|uniref:hypothetical protein n=1 Tax=Capnocytophaga sp. oral taxon 878 TaxID=1316596 RepID=UPI000D045C2C|nr:hypothetical protein [Capnocytophaga sp. oral taxon 878]AVM50553.1 hypothetical protein C4H12_08730 [Capnocytophaga sp. oral taxon 878]